MTIPAHACRSRHDKLAFAVHAFLLAQDYKLVATGAAAEDDSQGESAPCHVFMPASQADPLLYMRINGCLDALEEDLFKSTAQLTLMPGRATPSAA